ncbi:hypothetical protein V7S43_009791 [Phytophthora oleae]|uniref:Endonuclease/exonuclease/phosphatase domain-containing protein n=1 Tax=Phytophthora oleae TaxID=2107226 RepID=A0ABD3FE01_9STRA
MRLRRKLGGHNKTKGNPRPVGAPGTGHQFVGSSDAYGRHYQLEMEFEAGGQWKRPRPTEEGGVKLMTQNLQGFKKEKRHSWMKAWRSLPLSEQPDVIYVQETHITSQREAQELENEWRRLWHVPVSAPTMTFWSVGDKPAGGVGIVLTPRTQINARAWAQKQWSPRVIAVHHELLGLLVNVYA